MERYRIDPNRMMDNSPPSAGPELIRAFQENRMESYLAQAALSPEQKTSLSMLEASSWVDFAVKALRVLNAF